MGKKKSKFKMLIGVAVDDNRCTNIRQWPNPTKNDAKAAGSIREYNDLDGSDAVEISIFEVTIAIPKVSVKKAKAKKVKTVRHEKPEPDHS